MTKITYNKALSELDQILAELESGKIDVDNLAKQVKRAGELIQICQKKLRTTEDDINQLIKQIDEVSEDENE